MTQIEMLNVNGTPVQGLRVVAPGGEGHPNMLLILCKKGYVMCGYLNAEAAEKFGDAAAVVGGSCFEETLANPDKGGNAGSGGTGRSRRHDRRGGCRKVKRVIAALE